MLASKNLQEMIDKLAKIPLLYQPGTRWVYSVSMDIQGYIIEKLSGQSLPDFMQQHIFAPLEMKDSGFYVPQDKCNRFATLYGEDSSGALAADTTGGQSGRRRLHIAADDAFGRRRNGFYRAGLLCASRRCCSMEANWTAFASSRHRPCS